jgi:hypothetical protein
MEPGKPMNALTSDCRSFEEACDVQNDMFAGHEIIMVLLMSFIILLLSTKHAH